MQAADRYDSLIKWYAEMNGQDWCRLKAQIFGESSMNPDAVSPKGAVGLAQFMPRTWAEWRDGTPGIQPLPNDGKLLDSRDPEDAIRSMAAMMSWLISVSASFEEALARYNAGFGNIEKFLADPACAERLLDCVSKETRDYVERISTAIEQCLNP